MNKLKESLMEALRNAGLTVEAGGLWRMGAPVKQEKVCVQLLKTTAEDGAVHRYLGLDEQERELYGMQLKVEFALVMLTPKTGGGEGAEAFSETVMDLLLSGVTDMPILGIWLEEAVYDGVRDCFSQKIRVETMAMACGAVEDGTLRLEDFRITAVWK